MGDGLAGLEAPVERVPALCVRDFQALRALRVRDLQTPMVACNLQKLQMPHCDSPRHIQNYMQRENVHCNIREEQRPPEIRVAYLPSAEFVSR